MNLGYSAFSAEPCLLGEVPMSYIGVSIRVNSWLRIQPFYAKQTTFVEISLQIHPFLKKQTQFCPFFGPKTAILPKNEPNRTQFKAKQSQLAKYPK